MNKKLLFCLILSYSLLTSNIKAQTQVTFYTTKGNFVVQLYDVERPITTTNFISLVKKKFYDKIIFHRVIKNFMIQGGDPKGTGSGGSGVIIKDELNPPNINAVKTIAMANSGPNTGTSQFFISVKDNMHLNDQHSVFGIVISNYNVVEVISKVPTKSDKPVTPVVMDSVRITSLPTNVASINSELVNISIYPNPATSASTILIDATVEKEVTASIYNQQGQLVYIAAKKINNDGTVISFDEIEGSNRFKGLYYLVITDGTTVTTKKFIFIN
jgi:peptidyl-prolyl cis-trans isomerase A (cyclophilin A)